MIKLNKKECKFISQVLGSQNYFDLAVGQANADSAAMIMRAIQRMTKVLADASEDGRAGRYSPNIDLADTELAKYIIEKYA